MYDVQKSDEQKRKRFATYIVHKQTFKVSLRVSLLQYISDVLQISKILCVKKKNFDVDAYPKESQVADLYRIF